MRDQMVRIRQYNKSMHGSGGKIKEKGMEIERQKDGLRRCRIGVNNA